MVIDGVTFKLERENGTDVLIVQRAPFAISIRVTADALSQLGEQHQRDAKVLRDACETNFYAVLGIDRTATADAIKKAYRRLARRYHTDGQVGDEEKLKAVNNAYETLSNSARRTQYDQQCA